DTAIAGGTLVVDGELAGQRPSPTARGEVQLDDFVLVRAPAAIRLLSQAPVDVQVPPDAVAVSRTTAAFALENGVLSLTDGSLLGSELAITLDGSVDLAADELDFRGSLAPVATLNRMVGNLPLIGRLLRGESGAGAFVVTFAVAGPRDDPAVTVNPLSIITPGILRDLFAGVEITTSEEWFSDRPTD
ncbi:MAG: AsmA-like C-terminal domain-containing protein, partial [Pseudomonadota bacterium]